MMFGSDGATAMAPMEPVGCPSHVLARETLFVEGGAFLFAHLQVERHGRLLAQPVHRGYIVYEAAKVRVDRSSLIVNAAQLWHGRSKITVVLERNGCDAIPGQGAATCVLTNFVGAYE